jgi:4-hydroxy-tetrahydrodipicolinate reductase
MIKVVVMGAAGRMGREVCSAVIADPGLELVAAVDPFALDDEKLVALSKNGIAVFPERDGVDTGATDVMVDFTNAVVAVENIIWALEHGIHSVVGTTGITEPDMKRIKGLADSGKANVIMAPNFALGAVFMMKFSEVAAGTFRQSEIIEMHHRGKLDAPSGTAVETAKRISKASKAKYVPPADKEDARDSRGERIGDVQIHSVRLDGLVAHQEVIFGSAGETLRIRHDTTDRSCFMPGVLIAIKAAGSTPGLTTSLEPLLEI